MPLADQTTSRIVCRIGEECECEELCLRRGSPLAYMVMCFVSSSFLCNKMMLRIQQTRAGYSMPSVGVFQF